jgi:hypothetical protein
MGKRKREMKEGKRSKEERGREERGGKGRGGEGKRTKESLTSPL